MIELKSVHKTYQMGDSTVYALQDVSLSIEPGEFVAIMGPSGSGKSTLMHVLGLLDVPDSGSYTLFGQDINKLNDNGLALLRREAIGFVFQQFNLLPRLNALNNVAMPLLYSKGKLEVQRAKSLLERFGLGERLHHRPNELSGGQQQRVAIARSLINQPRIILADEPTGNLDSKSSEEIMGALKELNRQGIAIILVTHEEDVARHARRILRIRDGRIYSDEDNQEHGFSHKSEISLPAPVFKSPFRLTNAIQHGIQGFKALAANKVRTSLSMLGILIGVAAVVAMLALGRGAQESIKAQLASLGSNLLSLRPGAIRHAGVAMETGATTRLTFDDVEALKNKIPAIKDAAPSVTGRAQLTYQANNWNTMLMGVSPSYESVRSAQPQIGRFFTEEENRKRARVAVIGTTVMQKLFGSANPVGSTIKVNKVSFQIIGILPSRGATGFRDQDDVLVIPILTAMHRILGKDYVDSVDIQVANENELDYAQEAVENLMLGRHRVPQSQQQDAFEVRNMADIQAALTKTSTTMSYLLAAIAAISLLVGGIGIMNIMLVSVTERTREIGLRKAVGARRADILAQFLVESVVISTVGGFMGIVIGWIITQVMNSLVGWTTSISAGAVLLAFTFSSSVGIIFGLYPARKASYLHPIEALRSE